MTTQPSITDSTDWLSTPLSSFAPIDASLRCQVCKEFYDTPMLTSCSHTFCSRCIRRCLSQEGKCPACRASSQENQLRSNWVLEELVNAFKAAREGALDYARAHAATRSTESVGRKTSGKRKIDDVESDANFGESNKRLTRSSSRRMRSTQDSEVSLEEVEAERTMQSPIKGSAAYDGDFVPDDGLVACPMCNKRMKEQAVFAHIDHCTGDSGPSVPPTPVVTTPKKQISKPANNLIPLATLGYGLLNDNALRKKLSSLGISNSGSRLMMEQRHREWVTIWNSNCDAASPRKKADLLRELNVWERTQGSRYNHNNVTQVTDVRHKDFDREGYSEKQDLSFKELIASARKSRAKPGTATQPSPAVDDEISTTNGIPGETPQKDRSDDVSEAHIPRQQEEPLKQSEPLHSPVNGDTGLSRHDIPASPHTTDHSSTHHIHSDSQDGKPSWIPSSTPAQL